jgi:hypothetical protein
MANLPKDDEETRKAITSTLMRNPSGLVLFDNLAGPIASPILAQALTSRVWQDRVLGSSRTVDVPVRCCWFANGNNVDIRGDISRRAFYIRMDAQCAKPWQRAGFRHPNLLEWLGENRGTIVGCLLIMAAAWFRNSCPAAAMPVRLGSFEEWTRIVGGILSFSGADQFMGNAQKLNNLADSESSEWEAFLLALWQRYRKCQGLETRQFTAVELLNDLRRPGEFSSSAPASVSGCLDKMNTGAVGLGRVLRSRRDRRFGPAGLRICQQGQKSPVRWVVSADSEPDEIFRDLEAA